MVLEAFYSPSDSSPLSYPLIYSHVTGVKNDFIPFYSAVHYKK